MSQEKIFYKLCLGCIISSVICFFLNAAFPLIGLIVTYFAMRFVLKTIYEKFGAEKYMKHKRLWIGLYAAPYPIAIITAFILASPIADSEEYMAFWRIAGYFMLAAGISALFGQKISQSLVKEKVA